ncbi:MAG: histidinol-phosphate transaminase [Campylobacterota bacterium]|nr:histidinol-phosphate transaminase [Campylobacterota bacterium]
MQFNKVLDGIKTYEAGKPIELVVREYGIDSKDIVKLASNENPYGCSLHVKKAAGEIISKMALYPDDSMYRLKEALAERFEVKSDNIIIGAGSDQVIEFAVHAKANASRPVLMNSVTFAMYEIYARHVGSPIIRTTSQEHDLDQFYALYKEHNPSIIFICTPNNPTGDALDADKLITFLEKIDSDTLVVVDGAYMEYARYKDDKKAIDVEKLITSFSNVLYLGTFSKAYGLGGMRIGYGIADSKMIKALYKLRPPFNITTLSLEAATVALSDEAFVKESVIKSFEQMQGYEAFARDHDLDLIESYTNFITLCFKEPRSSSILAQELLKQGMIVRDLSSYGLNAIRVTVGKEDENSRFFDLCEKLL